ncbi:MAG: amidophosphoribosyltransferase [Armatimonadetes bacterium]|nr:amidophosphoribosyltransferase [Armatimonadota bacterium]NIM24246.1 amidophosphoribosyltransferase [Armatimonadota bacterium]NIM68115.1 amidophosphoribosyltransferase [Armatimonadota bacterium]NIM76577.1 amidophosphoribosyltransferase [Armatimonadota bacterium]NIN06320.1 amidophosphoribosyltransferase [Armatimonadota bacterium]
MKENLPEILRAESELRDHCGVFGVYGPGEEVARLTYFGLFALQHRGQESAGIVTSDEKRLYSCKQMGLVSQVFDEPALSRLPGHIAVGHTRYSTTGSSLECNTQPLEVESSKGPLVLAHNGNLVNTRALFDELSSQGHKLQGTTDSELMAQMAAEEWEKTGDLETALANCVPQWVGAYSLVMMTKTQLLGLRDSWGIRPLCLGRLNGDHYVLASETCALNVIDAELVREVEPGELIVIDKEGLRSEKLAEPKPAMCIFEFIYFARPDSYIYGRSLHNARKRMGQLLAQEHPVKADIVIPVPDTGWPAAIGFAEASRIPFGEGLIKSRYIHRTFIQPDQRQRDMGVKMKLTPLREALAGKRVVVVEDSIVRGTTTRNIVKLLKDAGASQVHLRISSPPYRFPCFYGIDTFDRRQLLAARVRSVEEIRQYLGADSLGYLSLKGLIKAVGLPRKCFCAACFSANYPIPVPSDLKVSKFALEENEWPQEAAEKPKKTRKRKK